MTAAKRKKLRCSECHKWFPPKRDWQKFCGRKCRNDSANRLRKEALDSVRYDEKRRNKFADIMRDMGKRNS